MKSIRTKQIAALALAWVLAATTSTQALFGKKETPPEGAPTVAELEIRTYRNIPYQAQFLSDGEDVTFQLEKAPRKGTVTIEGDTFTYAPNEGFTGGDSFTYTATDSRGRISAPAEVEVRVEKTRSGVRYADMDGNTAAAAAQTLAEEGIFTGSRIGERYYFEPEKSVCRSEFLAMAMEALGKEATAVTMTGFCDDAAIPAWAKAYASAGVAEGMVYGKSTAEGTAFLGDEPVTWGQAAAILNRGLRLSDVDLDDWYGDREEVSSWAAQAVGNLEAVSVLEAGSFGSQTLERAVTRADAVKLLVSARALMESEKASGRFLWF